MIQPVRTNDNLCFVIGPYGTDGTENRKWSDFLCTQVIQPALKEDYVVERTIDNPDPGKITEHIERNLSGARVVIADLTAANPNAYFELGFRHALERPIVHLARAKTALPFDIRDFHVIEIDADYIEAAGYFTIHPSKLNDAQNLLRAQIQRVLNQPVSRPKDPYSMKVYQWEMEYSPRIAKDWLARQETAFRDQISSYEGGGGADSVSEDSLPEFAEYLALKGAASLSGQGIIFVTMNNHTGKLDFGYSAFKFSIAPEEILINVTDVTCSADGVVASISFRQDPRPFPIERGGRTVNVMIPGYKYTLLAEPNPSCQRSVVGDIAHPRTKTLIGKAELTPKYGKW